MPGLFFGPVKRRAVGERHTVTPRPSRPTLSRDLNTRVRAAIVAIRLAAAIITIATVVALWNLMLWLPWQVDCTLAAAAAFTFAYTFERERSC